MFQFYVIGRNCRIFPAVRGLWPAAPESVHHAIDRVLVLCSFLCKILFRMMNLSVSRASVQPVGNIPSGSTAGREETGRKRGGKKWKTKESWTKR